MYEDQWNQPLGIVLLNPKWDGIVAIHKPYLPISYLLFLVEFVIYEGFLSASGLEEETKKPHSMLGLLLRVLYTTNEKAQLCKFNYVVFVYFCKDRLICFFVGIEILSRWPWL